MCEWAELCCCFVFEMKFGRFFSVDLSLNMFSIFKPFFKFSSVQFNFFLLFFIFAPTHFNNKPTKIKMVEQFFSFFDFTQLKYICCVWIQVLHFEKNEHSKSNNTALQCTELKLVSNKAERCFQVNISFVLLVFSLLQNKFVSYVAMLSEQL